MPELPEVETIKRGLESKIIGLVIQKIDILNPKSFQGAPESLIGATITNIWRRAKLLGIDLTLNSSKKPKTNDHPPTGGLMTLLIHLKMSGQLILIRNSNLEFRNSEPYRLSGGHPTPDMMGKMPNKSTRVIFHLSSSSLTGGSIDSRLRGNDKKNKKDLTLNPSRFTLYFNDQRKFGWIKVANSQELIANSFLQKLGPEPLEPAFTDLILKSVLSRHLKMPIKVAILDQSAIAGIGNIYASEACFLAKINPTTPVNKLTDQDYSRLHQGIIQSLESSIKYGGSSKHTYVNESGQKGYFLEVANVYNRKGLPCRICSTPIQKITLGGRGTYFCPICQT